MHRTHRTRAAAVVLALCLLYVLLGGTFRGSGAGEDAPALPDPATAELAPQAAPAEEEPPAYDPTEEPVMPVAQAPQDSGPEETPAPAKSCFLNGSFCGLYQMIDGVAYVCVQGVFAALADNAHFTADSETLLAETDGISLSAQRGEEYFVCNDRYLHAPGGVLFEEDGVYLSAEALAHCFGGSVALDSDTEYLDITVGELVPLESGETFYNEDDLYWMSHVIYSEAGCESLTGQIAVGNVVLHRIDSGLFPGQDDIQGVIFARGQFQVVDNGSIYLEPTETAVIAAKLALEGFDVVPGALFFATGYFGGSYICLGWIGAHCFMTLA